MKKLFISVVLLLFVVQVNAQSKAAADALKGLNKAKADTENPKKGGVPATWVKLSSAYNACFDAPITGIWQGASQMELKMLLKDQQVLSSTKEEKNGRMFSAEEYADKVLYYDENGTLAAWTVKQPTIDGDALALSFDALNKAIELDAKKSQSKAITEGLKGLQTRYINEAMNNYTLGNNSAASKDFEKAWEIAGSPLIGLVDSTMAYYAAVTASMAGERERAIKLLEYCASISYDQNGDVYATLADNYKMAGDTVKAKQLLANGFEKYPTSQSILVALINIYMESNDDPAKVLDILKVAQKNEPNNASLYYAEGSVYRKLNKFKEAIESFRTSAKVDPNYVFAPFSEGSTYYDWAIDIQDQAQKEMDDAKFEALQKEMEQALENAIEPFERAFGIAKDNDVKLACAEYLKNIYFRFRDKSEESKASYEKYNKFVEENK